MELSKIKKTFKENNIDFEFKDGKNPHFKIKVEGKTIHYYVKKDWFQGVGFPSGRGLIALIESIHKKATSNSDFYTNNEESYSHIIGIFQKHFGKKIPDRFKGPIKEDLKRRFDIKLKQ